MEKKTIGAFIAALRKANGMTQQELADRLNISNKAVSRWERDECAPDISLIPALAEILGVTCDELLKGERILSDKQQEKSEPKVEKQVKAIINRSISKFTTLIWISIALSAVGLICMFAVSYGAFRSVIGFAVMGIFTVAAFVIAAIATTKMKSARNENELFENADTVLINRYNKTLGNFSFIAFFISITVVALSLPLVIVAPYPSTFLDPVSYLKCFGFIIFISASLWIILKDKYSLWITEQPREKINHKLILMNSLQLGAVALAVILFVIAPYYKEVKEISTEVILYSLAYVLLAVSVVIFIIFISVCKSDRKKLLLSGLRNLLLVIPSVFFQFVHDSYLRLDNSSGMHTWERTDLWNTQYLLILLGAAVLIFVIFELINKYISKRSTKNGLANS